MKLDKGIAVVTEIPDKMLQIRKSNEEKIFIPTFIHNGEPCWVATDVLKRLGYSDVNSLIKKCLKTQRFDEGIEYDVIKHNKLKDLKEIVNKFEKENNIEEPIIDKKTSSITVFYRSGLIGFLCISRKQVADEFKKWIRREVVPSIMRYGMYISSPILEDKDLLVRNLNMLLANKKKEMEEMKEKYENELAEEREKYQKKADSFSFIIMLKEDAEQTLEKERKKVRKLKKKIREIGPQTDEYGNKLTDYEKEVVLDISDM